MKILIASSIDPDAIKYLEQKHDVICAFGAKEGVLKEKIFDREVLVFRSGVQITAEVMAAAPQLKLILRGGSGTDNIDLDYVNERSFEFIRIPGPGARAVAEMAFGFMIALARNMFIADKMTRQGQWMKQQMTGYLLKGKTLGIVGAGNIGTQTGELGVAWGMDVIGCVNHPTAEKERDLKVHGIHLTTFEEVLSQSDFVCLHVPLQDSTRHLMSAGTFALMKQGAYFVNLARGGVIDEQALLDALTNGRLAGAALDVHAQEGEGKISPLAELDNVILTPHIGASAFDSQREIGDIIINAVEKIALRQHSNS
jgi:phosphoglycerate dehydrogenase-like enzyme